MAACVRRSPIAVVGWIDMVLTIAAWPPGTSAARLVAGAGLRNSPAYLTRR